MKHVHIYSGGGLRLAFMLRLMQRHMEQYGLRPALIVGSSAGALLGALMAAGTTPSQIEHVLARIAQINPRNITRVLRELLEQYITKIPTTPIVIQCASLNTGHLVRIDGQQCISMRDYHNLLASSCNIPLIMGNPGEVRTAHGEYDSLSDGGIYDHLPIAAALPHIRQGDKVTAVLTAQAPAHSYPRHRLARQARQIRLIWAARPLEGLRLLPADSEIYRPASPLPAPWRWGGKVIARHMDIAEDTFTLHPAAP